MYDKYVLRSLIRLFTATLMLAALLLWLGQSLKILEMLTTNGISIVSFAKISLMLFTPICFIMIPIAASIAVVGTLYSLIINKELVILRAAGCSNYKITKPIFKFAVVVMIMEFVISFYMMPQSYRQYKNLQQEYRNHILGVFLEEGTFNNQLGKITVYINSKVSENNYKGIFIYNHQNTAKPSTIIADSGYLILNKQSPEFILYNGIHQEKNTASNNLSQVTFDSYHLRLNDFSAPKEQRISDSNEYYIHDLLMFRDFSFKEHRAHFVNANHRIVWPMFCLSLAMLCSGIMLWGNLGRTITHKNMLISGAAVILFLMIDLSINNYSTKNINFVYLLYANLVVSFILAQKLLFQRRD